jgi:hypothetical protein
MVNQLGRSVALPFRGLDLARLAAGFANGALFAQLGSAAGLTWFLVMLSFAHFALDTTSL